MALLQTLNNLSDEQAGYQCLDRLSFQRFLGGSFADTIPDAKTLWLFKEQLKEHELGRVSSMSSKSNSSGTVLSRGGGGGIVDATLSPAPIQRNNREENELIKSDAVPIDWSINPHKRRQKTIEQKE